MAFTSDISDGSRVTYPINWPFLLRDHVQVTVEGVQVPFTWVNDGEITLSTPASAGKEVIRSRNTPNNPLVDFHTGYPLTEGELDLVARQGVYLAGEAKSWSEGAIRYDLNKKALTAMGRRLGDLAYPTEVNDAVTKGWAEDFGSSILGQSKAIRDQLFTLAPSVEWTPAGSNSYATYNAQNGEFKLYLPSGPTGDKGPQGDAGPQGAPGAPGPMGDSPMPLAFAEFRVTENGVLQLSYVGDLGGGSLSIGEDGRIYATT